MVMSYLLTRPTDFLPTKFIESRFRQPMYRTAEQKVPIVSSFFFLRAEFESARGASSDWRVSSSVS